ncbi:MAG: PIN domain-containing protein [Methylobacter sp.]|nr:PIN domain-containing protein [Methylobacter sp.]
MSDERQFVDSNIWLYAFIHRPDEVKRHEQARNLIRHSRGITVSEQVIAEVSVNLLKKGMLSELQLGRIVEAFYRRYRVFAPSLETHQTAGKLRGRYCLSYWDSLIVAAALQTNCTILYSEDMQNGLVFDEGLRIVNPLEQLG